MAQAGQRTLIVDADLLAPRQHEIFGLSNDMGLANVLAGEATLAQAIHIDGDHGPDILPSGRVRSHTSELLNSRAFLDMLRALSETYDQILIDSPPLLSVTDPLVLAAISDVTILVLRAERSHRKMAEQARDGLTSVGARVFGAVVNDVKGQTARYGGYYRYYSGRHEYGDAGPQEKPAGAEKS
jgi:capsular exopolysaccharide synthesis family protein